MPHYHVADWIELMTQWSAMAKGNGRDWYLADSLIALGNEINARWPNRDTGSDGAIGDASHQARKSDHNPDWSNLAIAMGSKGVVRAIDIDNGGINVQELLDATIGDPRVWYVIWDRHIYSRTHNWEKQVYNGTDDHTGHLHISLNHTKAAETGTAPWFKAKPPTTPEGGLSVSDVDKILAYQKACTIQIQANFKALLANSTAAVLKAVNATDADVEALNAELDKRDAELLKAVESIPGGPA